MLRRYAETYGFGLFVDQAGGETVIDHSGDIAPFHSAVFFVPQVRFGVVMLINTDSSKTIGKVMQEAVTLVAPPPTAIARSKDCAFGVEAVYRLLR